MTGDPTADADLRIPELADALQAEDTAAVALAVRTHGVVVPLVADGGHDRIRVFRKPESERYMLLLFSSVQAYATMTPDEADRRARRYDRGMLLDFLTQNEEILEAVIFDLAGPHAMQAEPAEIRRALELGV